MKSECAREIMVRLTLESDEEIKMLLDALSGSIFYRNDCIEKIKESNNRAFDFDNTVKYHEKQIDFCNQIRDFLVKS